ncbi:enoyl-CoA hydratase/isomerase family protein [Glaciecola sp. XM2]|uniref:enoyl-CoA hydratase-related protein n=1 Tax=Glaciecola sp. XM2 TaxID=1914931 RepID=UPI001BDEDF5C|nr:enoyl-CoA hydratase-related protein [Glaciecola sp. XM2]MBT1449514.1 enoyl-CoA hydratase/isomerase family protein [Glaciecola sp. XM2]
MINVEVRDSVLHLQINRPEKKNALLPSMYLALAIAIEDATASNAKVVLIEGSEGCFTAGNDVSEFMNSDESEEINETYRFMQALLNCPLPVVAKVEGLAIGIGTTLLLHCDFVLAHANTKFAMPFINLGLVPEYASSYIIPRICGHLVASELLMLGEVFTAGKALSAGLINSAHNDDLDSATNALLQKLTNKPASALQQTKMLLKNDKTHIKAHIDEELKWFVKAMHSEAAKEAFSAFIEKRPVDTNKFK